MKFLKIKSIRDAGVSDVHDITVADHHNYILENGVITHNSGLKYVASQIAFLSKARDKDGTDVVGAIITVRLDKSRFTREQLKIKVRLSFSKGLDRYYGLLEIAEAAGVFKKNSTRFEMPDGSKMFGKAILNNPEKYFTQEVLEKIDEYVKRTFKYNNGEFEVEPVAYDFSESGDEYSDAGSDDGDE